MPGETRDAGIQALKGGDLQSAVRLLSAAAQENPADTQAFAYLGMAYGQSNLPREAAGALRQACRLAPASAQLRYNLGMALERCGETAEAAAEYGHALQLDGTYERARQALQRLGTQTIVDTAPIATPPAVPTYGPPPVPGAGAMLGAQTIVDAGPPAGPPTARQPLGDWAPPPAPEGGLANYQTAPPPPQTTHSAARSEPSVTVLESAERELSDFEQLGCAYVAGLGMGAWWGLMAAATTFVGWMALPAKSMQHSMPLILTTCAMAAALGVLMYGVIGVLGANADDSEQTCGNLGLVVGLGAAAAMVYFSFALIWVSMAPILGCLWISRRMGQSLGTRINEMRTQVLVAVGSGTVGVTAHRPR